MKHIVLGIVNNTNNIDEDIISIINYVLYKGSTKAMFSDWILHRNIYDFYLNKHTLYYNQTAINIFNRIFDININNKDLGKDKYYCINNKTVKYNIKNIYHEKGDPSNIFTNKDLKYIGLDTLFYEYKINIEKNYTWFKWINKDIDKLVNIATAYNYGLYTNIDKKAIKQIPNNESLYGGGIIIYSKDEDIVDYPDGDNVFYINRDDNKTIIFYNIINIITEINKHLK